MINKDLKSNLIDNVVLWADNKGILKKEFLFKQILKKDEELGELSQALFNENRHDIIDAIGDIQVTLIINAKVRGIKIIDTFTGVCTERSFEYLYKKLHLSVSECSDENATSYNFSKAFSNIERFCDTIGLDSVECLKVAYDVISKRKTRTVNGKVFKD